MRIVVLCAEPESAERDPESVPSILRDLGCDVLCGRFDFGLIDEVELHRRPASIVVIDAGDEVERGLRSLRKLGDYAPLVDVPALLAVTVARLPGLRELHIGHAIVSREYDHDGVGVDGVPMRQPIGTHEDVDHMARDRGGVWCRCFP